MNRDNLHLSEYDGLLKLVTYELFYELIYRIFYGIISKRLEIYRKAGFDAESRMLVTQSLRAE